jgi:hypothetical protein
MLKMGAGRCTQDTLWKSLVASSSACNDGSRGTGQSLFTLKLETGAGHLPLSFACQRPGRVVLNGVMPAYWAGRSCYRLVLWRSPAVDTGAYLLLVVSGLLCARGPGVDALSFVTADLHSLVQARKRSHDVFHSDQMLTVININCESGRGCATYYYALYTLKHVRGNALGNGLASQQEKNHQVDWINTHGMPPHFGRASLQ